MQKETVGRERHIRGRERGSNVTRGRGLEELGTPSTPNQKRALEGYGESGECRKEQVLFERFCTMISSGMVNESTASGGCVKAKSTSHMMMRPDSRVANRRNSPQVQIWRMMSPFETE